jgi:hypothetical protein
MQRTRMLRLTTVRSSFHARVIAARLGAEGIVVQLRGNVDGIYPMGDTHLFVDADELDTARELLLVDEVESAFDGPSEAADDALRWPLWVVLAAVVAVAATGFSRALW